MRYPDFSEAACADLDTDLFYPDPSEKNNPQMQVVKKICKSCPVQRDCLEWGLHHEKFGIWGGTNTKDREIMRSRRGIRVDTLSHVFAGPRNDGSVA